MNILDLKHQLRSQFTRQRTQERDTPELRQRFEVGIARELKREAKRLSLTPPQLDQITQDLLNDLFGFGPLQPLLDDPDVAEVMINGPHHIFAEINGLQRAVGAVFDDEQHLLELINKIVRLTGQRLDESNPTADGVFHGDVRFNVAIKPVAINGPLLTLRKPRADIKEVEDLISRGTLSEGMFHVLWACIASKRNIIFSGATGTGKTTLLEVFSQYISDQERLVTIEDTPELRLRQHNVARLCTRPPNIEGKGEVTLRHLFVNALRMRPTRIILGEIRGAEAFDYLQSINSGHQGSLAVIHASTPAQVGPRLENLAQLSGVGAPAEVFREQLLTGVDLIIQVERYPDGTRKISEIAEPVGLDERGMVTVQPLFSYSLQGLDPQSGRCVGAHVAHGVKPTFFETFRQYGLNIDERLFNPPARSSTTPQPPPLP